MRPLCQSWQNEYTYRPDASQQGFSWQHHMKYHAFVVDAHCACPACKACFHIISITAGSCALREIPRSRRFAVPCYRGPSHGAAIPAVPGTGVRLHRSRKEPCPGCGNGSWGDDSQMMWQECVNDLVVQRFDHGIRVFATKPTCRL